ncbi:conserved hypothetical protein [Planktothrix serta PCC 8927]|uniref:Uncharacterized protein n=2 Tax=Planktothrix TaxID=54304 RepID=A0A7Z9BS74_9CYAN|nr:conserved hypothetical protein [Planktothrix serta PCC 8927]
MMNFEKIWQQYDFTESELLSMGLQLPYDYVLNINYYWQLNSNSTNTEIATTDQMFQLILKSCIHVDIQFNVNQDELNSIPTHLGTIVGWGRVIPSSWIQSQSLSEQEWLHLFFEIGGNNRIELVCKSLVVEHLNLKLLTIKQ